MHIVNYCLFHEMLCLFLGRPEPPFRTGLAYVSPEMFNFFRHAFSEVPRPIGLKLCHVVGIWLCFINRLQKFGGALPKKIGAKNMQNFGRFWSTSDFGREYLRNG